MGREALQGFAALRAEVAETSRVVPEGSGRMGALGERKAQVLDWT